MFCTMYQKELFKAVFNPKSIAVIGASNDIKSVGFALVKNLLSGCFFSEKFCMPFKGKVFLINPKKEEIFGIKCIPSISSVEEVVDIAIIAVPAHIVSKVLAECGEKHVKLACIISAGFAEVGKNGLGLQSEVVEIAKKYRIRIIGPNCLGLVVPGVYNASFAPAMPKLGSVAFISQSGALMDSVIDWSIEREYGFSALFSLGNMSDLEVVDFIELLEDHDETKVIAVYMEWLKDGKKFMRIASNVSRKKPIVILKGGSTEFGLTAAKTHTAAIATSFETFKAACKQSGIVVVESLQYLLDVAFLISSQPKPSTNAFAIITNAGGAGILTSDYCNNLGINLVELKEQTIEKLEKSGKMHSAFSRSNPLDLVGDATPERYKIALEALLAEDYISGVLALMTLQTMTNTKKVAEAIVAAKKFGKPIIPVFLGGVFTKPGVRILNKNNVACFSEPFQAVKALSVFVKASFRGRERASDLN